MRKVDEIKSLKKQVQELQYEIGRRENKIGEQGKYIKHLRERLAKADEGSRQTQYLVDALLMAVVEAHGVDAEDPDKTGLVLGKRLEVPCFSVEKLRGKYVLHARKDTETNSYVLGLVPREEPLADKPEKGDGEA